MALDMNQVLEQVLYRNRIPRSCEFQTGMKAFLNFELHNVKTIVPYFIGTAEADAFYAGWDAAKNMHKKLQSINTPPTTH